MNRRYEGEVTLLDRYGNVRVGDDRQVMLSANQAGVSSSSTGEPGSRHRGVLGAKAIRC